MPATTAPSRRRRRSSAPSKLKMIERMEKVEKPAETTRGLRIHGTPALQSYQEVLELRGLSRRFGDKILFEGLTFALFRGERLGIIGPNGSGKTTLLKTVAGEGKPDAGQCVLGTNVRFRYFAQDLADLNPENTVLEELLESAELTIQECCDALGRFMLGCDALEK